MIKWKDCFYLVPGSELREGSVRSAGSDQSLSLSARSNTHSVSVLTELAWPSMLVIMSSTFLVTVTVMTGSDLGLSWVWPPTWSPGRLRSRMVTVHLPSSNPREAFQKKNLTSWKGYFWPNKSDVFSSNLGRGGHLSHFFFKASLTLANNFDSSLRWDHWWWYQRWCDTVLCTVIIIILPWKCWLIISECCLHRISSLATVIIYDWIFVLNELDNSPNRVVLVIRLLRHVLCTLDFWKVY